MHLLIAALVFAQTSVNVGVGRTPERKDSVAAGRRESAEVFRQQRDSARRVVRSDSSDIKRRRARQIQLTPALMASAFKDPRAGILLGMARKARLQQDSSLTGYDAKTYERMSVGLGFKRIGRERLLMRMERAARVVWSKNTPAYVEILGKREVMPMLDGIGDAEIDIDDGVPIPYYPGRETLWVG